MTTVERKTTTRESVSEKVNTISLILTRNIALVITDIVQPHRTFGINETTHSSSDHEYFLNHLKTHHTSTGKADKWKTCTIQINEISIVAEPDCGSDTNIMDESQFAKFQKQAPDLKIKATKIKLKVLKEELPVIGEVDVEMSNETRTVPTSIIVIKGKIDSPPLIGRQTREALGMLLIDVT